MACIGLVPHGQRAVAGALADEIGAWLEERGHGIRLLTDDDTHPWSCPGADFADGLDLAVSLGGDGTMLRTVDLVSSSGVAVLGVNVGHLGYLTEVGPDGLRDALLGFLAGRHRIEERMTLRIEVVRLSAEAGPTVAHALNDAVLQRTASGHTIRLAMSVDGEPFLTYAADSMIVASPTGSTAYNLSARGPVVSPRARVIVVTPVAAHMLFDRALVLAPPEQVAMELIDGRSAELVVDGQSWGVLGPGDVVRCREGDYPARLVTFGARDFHQILKQKFGLSDR